MRYSDGHALIRRGKAGSLTLFIDENIDWTKRQEVSLPELDLSVVDYPNCWCVPLNGGSGACKSEPWVRRTVVDRSTYQRVTLVNVVRLGGRQNSPLVIKPMRTGEIGLLEIVMSGIKLSVVDRVYAAEERIVITFRYPAQYKHAGRVRRWVPRRDVVTSMDTKQNRPVVI